MADEARPSPEALAQLNAASPGEARQLLERCCGATRWVEAMLARRPFASASALMTAATAVWSGLGPSDFREAFSHHPEIGAKLDELREKFADTAALSLAEQASVSGASDDVLLTLRAQNRAYRERFGYVFIVCASGKSAQHMLTLLEQRLSNAPERELYVAAAEQAKITRLRLEKI
jgi:2-oxo-4-hydroxy-4-carboxy-5-ureidoimidazoline decarboxylase